MNDSFGEGSGQVGEIRPCLIGGFRECGAFGLLTDSTCGVPRYKPYVSPDGSICSLDMVRLRVKFRGTGDNVAHMEDRVQRIQWCDSFEQYSMGRSRPGRYAHLYTVGFGDSTVSLGVGQFVKGAQADMNKGFIEFNPNKLGSSETFARFLELLEPYVYNCWLVRYDLAVDVPVARTLVRTRKDRRKYSFEQGAVMTEYLGIRNAVGRVKVYDKAAELGVSGMDLTRIEMTCSGDWSVEGVVERWPTVYRVSPYDAHTDKWVSVMAGALSELAEMGGSPEKYLNNLDPHTRKKVRGMLEGVTYPCPVAGATHVLLQAIEWAGKLSEQVVA